MCEQLTKCLQKNSCQAIIVCKKQAMQYLCIPGLTISLFSFRPDSCDIHYLGVNLFNISNLILSILLVTDF